MLDVLEQFKTDVNTNAQIQRIVKSWNTGIFLEEKDTAIYYRLTVKDGRIDEVTQASINDVDDSKIKIVGIREILKGLFQGKVNGIRANNDGLIEIYGSMSDQVKLDAIALILWGI